MPSLPNALIARFVPLALAALLLVPLGARADFSGGEVKCSRAMAKAVGKLHRTVIKETGRCRDNDIAGKRGAVAVCDPLPDKAAAKIEKARAKVLKSVTKKCASVCSVSNGVVCMEDLDCPPRGAANERCTGKGGKNPLSISDMGFPGPHCPAILGGEISSAADLSDCLNFLGERVGNEVVDNLYGSVDGTSGLDATAGKCLASLAKSVGKTTTALLKEVGKCRDAVNAGDSALTDPSDCPTGDADTEAGVAKIETKFTSKLSKSCPVSALAGLDLCGTGIGGIATAEDLEACALSLARAAAFSEVGPADRSFVVINLIDAAYPDAGTAICGDDLLNIERNAINQLGEECDGDNNSACGGGNCLPAGDVWECTCDNIPRIRTLTTSVDSDAGWTGNSHDAPNASNQGWLADITGCDCDDMDGTVCVGTSIDNSCDLVATLRPVCSNAPNTGETCDERGDNDDEQEDHDCSVCDDSSANPGDLCTVNENPDETVCQSQCFDGDDLVTGLCSEQADCADGSTCRGRCDTRPTCNVLLEGSPTPLVSAQTGVCTSGFFTTDLAGDFNIVTGEMSVFYENRAKTHLGGDGATQLRPCPECIGSCLGGLDNGDSCLGRCDVSAADCLVDSDCTGLGDTACLEESPECEDGPGDPAVCNLSPVCSFGPNDGRPCRPFAEEALGIVSPDCPPDPLSGITGAGTHGSYQPLTSETVSISPPVTCTAEGFENFECDCPPGDTGTEAPSEPNNCLPACDLPGPLFGKGCGTKGSLGEFTVCVGGSEIDAACDEDTDCDGGTCSGNPTHCTAGGATDLGALCSVDSDCDSSLASGDGVCGDACPGGRCVPLCGDEGECTGGGTNDGHPCINDSFCTGGGVCGPGSNPEGACLGSPAKFRCNGNGFAAIPCSFIDAGTGKACEDGGDGIPGNDDDIAGAGICLGRPAECALPGSAAEGGDLLNGGAANGEFNLVASFCVPPVSFPTANQVSGFGGPQRVRRSGVILTNFSSLP